MFAGRGRGSTATMGARYQHKYKYQVKIQLLWGPGTNINTNKIHLLWRPCYYKYKPYMGQVKINTAHSVELGTPDKPFNVSDCRCARPVGRSFAGQSSRGTTPPTSASRTATARSPSRLGKTVSTADTSEFSFEIEN